MTNRLASSSYYLKPAVKDHILTIYLDIQTIIKFYIYACAGLAAKIATNTIEIKQ